jgi:hypothetical protein
LAMMDVSSQDILYSSTVWYLDLAFGSKIQTAR